MKSIQKTFCMFFGLMAVVASMAVGFIPAFLSHASATTVSVKKSATYKYASYGISSSWSTSKYTVTFPSSIAESGSHWAYCICPNEHSPSGGTYTISNANAKVAKILYWADFQSRFTPKGKGYWDTHHTDYSAGKKWCITHLAAGKANGAGWTAHCNSSTESVVNALYNWCMDQSALPTSSFHVNKDGSEVTGTDNYDASKIKKQDAGTDTVGDKSTISGKCGLDTSLPCTDIYRLKCDSDDNTVTVTAPAHGYVVYLDEDKNYKGKTSLGGSATLKPDYWFYVVAEDTSYFNTDPLGTKKTLTVSFKSKAYTSDYKCYKLTSKGSSKQDLACIVTTTEPNSFKMTFQWNKPIVELDLNIVKTGDEGTALSGAVYGIYTSSKATTLIAQFPATGTDGKAYLKLTDDKLPDSGTVYFKEITAPEGYSLDDEAYPYDLDDEDVQTQFANGVTFTDKRSVRIEVVKKALVTDGPVYDKDGKASFEWKEGSVLPDTAIGLFAGQDNMVIDDTTYNTGDMIDSLDTEDDGTAVFDSKDLILGKYYVQELEAPDGYMLDSTKHEFEITADDWDNTIKACNKSITITDKQMTVDTVATYTENGTHIVPAVKDVKITDAVSYTGLTKGKSYTIKTSAVIKDSGEEVPVSAPETSFVPDAEDGTMKVNFTVDGSALSGKQIVIYEEITGPVTKYEEDENGDVSLKEVTATVLSHKDSTDADQTLTFPSVHTNAYGFDKDSKTAAVSEKCTVTDIVTFSGLTAGEEWTLKAKLVDRQGQPLKDAKGNEITAEKTFTPEAESGSTEVVFEFDSTGLEGMTAVVYEDLYLKDVEYARHENPEDEQQTVYFPGFHTKALNAVTGDKMIFAGPDAQATDEITYDSLTAQKKYKAYAVLMDKESGKELTDVDGKTITSEAEFVPESSSGSAMVSFKFNATGMEGKTAVAFEYIYSVGDDGTETPVGTHTNLNDADQTLFFPEIHTTAIDTATGSHILYADSVATVKDTVFYSGLTADGREYTIKGTAMDKETGETLKDSEGNAVTGEAVFTPEASEGTADVTFTFNAEDLTGHTIVFFEDVSYVPDGGDEVVVGVHEDIEDEEQTIRIPSVGTTLTNKEDGSHDVTASSKITLTDQIKFDKVIAGKTYILKGTLMDQETGNPFKDKNGNTVTSDIKFTANVESGHADVTFKFDATGLGGKSVVAFERLYLVEDGSEKLIAVHEDIDDEGQTVTLTTPPTTTTPPVKTGDTRKIYIYAVGAVLLLIAAIGLIVRLIRRK